MSNNNQFDDSFLFYYLETIKEWLIFKVELDSLIKEA